MSKKSFLVYLSTLLLLIVLVLIKQKIIILKNEKAAISFYSSWSMGGKPVEVHTLEKTAAESNWKTTLLLDSEDTYLSYVPKAIHRYLTLTTPVTIHWGDEKIAGKIIEIGTEIQRETGMYPIKISYEDKKGKKPMKCLAELTVSEAKDVFILPYDSLHTENNQSFVWVVKEGKAHKQFVEPAERCVKGVIVKEIEEKDLILQGSEIIKENDSVRITRGQSS